MAWTNHKLTRQDGAALNYHHAIPNGQIKAVVQINHGMAEHSARYERFANALAIAGYASYAHDHRGHGATVAPGSAQGHFAGNGGWQIILDDVLAVNNRIQSDHPGIPIICFGHSMGSIMALNHILRQPDTIAAAILCNSGADANLLTTVFRTLLKIQRMFKGSDVPSGLAKKLSFETWNKVFTPNRTEFDWLSRDEAEVDKYIKDPLCGFDVSIGLWLDVLEGISFGADDTNLAQLPEELPVFLLAGGADPCTENGKAMANISTRMKGRAMSDVTLSILPDTRHESLNETNRDETTAALISWLDARFG